MIVMKTEDWHEDLGDCLFFHFENFEEPPTCVCATPLDSVFEEGFFTHFVKDFDFNDLFEQVIQFELGMKDD